MTAPAPAIELGFFVEHEALFYKASSEQPCLKICQAFEITDIAQNAGKAEYVIKISFQSVAQQKQTILIDLRWSNNKLRSMLDAAAFEIEPARIAIDLIKKYIAQQLKQAKQADITQLVEKTGWSNSSYILANRVIGSSKVAFKNNYLNPAPVKACDLGAWQKHVAQPAQAHTVLHFALATAFAAAHLTPLKEQGGGFHLVGESSIGKSTAQYIAQSVFSNPSQLLTWRTTDNSLEYTAKAHNDQRLVLDELGQADEKTASKAAYFLANGAGKSRMGQATPEWTTLLLSSGETDFETISKSALHPGQLIRIVNIPVTQIIENPNGKAIAESLVNNAKQYNSTAIDVFIKHFQANKASIENRWSAYKNAFIERALTALNSQSAQLGRLLNKFAVVAFAAQIASECNLIDPLNFETLFEKLIKPATIFLSDAQAQSALDIALNAVLQTIEKDESRFQSICDDKPLSNRLGYFSQGLRGQKVYHFFAKSLKNLFTNISAKAAIQALYENDYLTSTAAKPKQFRYENHSVFTFDPNPPGREDRHILNEQQMLLDVFPTVGQRHIEALEILMQANDLRINLSLNEDGSLNIEAPEIGENALSKRGRAISRSYISSYKQASAPTKMKSWSGSKKWTNQRYFSFLTTKERSNYAQNQTQNSDPAN